MPRAAGSWTSFSRTVLETIWPRTCSLCGLLAEESPCAACRSEFAPAAPALVRLDGHPLAYRASVCRYEGRAAQAVRRLKFARCTSMGEALAQILADQVVALGLKPDAAVPVPIHWSRRCQRGFNQSELLAERMPVVRTDLLARIRATRPQVGLSHAERTTNLQGAFLAQPSCAGLRILLVDDVVTSGHTALECAKALKAAGAVEVGILAFAGEATPVVP